MYINLVFLLVSFLASVVGAICGIGGGVIIKPSLDATGVLGVSTISFLSSCTVLSMTIISVYRLFKKKDVVIDLKISTPLAIGGAVGGMVGKYLFQYAISLLPNEDKVGAIQAALLIFITLGTLTYIINSKKIKTLHVINIFICGMIGLGLGIMSSFLGIGGGPINLVVLYYFFSMSTKQAAANSLYIILFSQVTSFTSTQISGSTPEFEWLALILMVFGGVTGGIVGGKLNKKISNKGVEKLFIGLMIVIILINVYNFSRFMD